MQMISFTTTNVTISEAETLEAISDYITKKDNLMAATSVDEIENI
jgi:hypothetical protein